MKVVGALAIASHTVSVLGKSDNRPTPNVPNAQSLANGEDSADPADPEELQVAQRQSQITEINPAVTTVIQKRFACDQCQQATSAPKLSMIS